MKCGSFSVVVELRPESSCAPLQAHLAASSCPTSWLRCDSAEQEGSSPASVFVRGVGSLPFFKESGLCEALGVEISFSSPLSL